MKRRTAPKKRQAAIARMKAWLKSARHLPKGEFYASLKRKLVGHYNYYYVRGNSQSVWSFYKETIECTYKWLNRRSQRKSFSWAKFKGQLEIFKVPVPKPTEKRRLHRMALG